MESKAYYIQQVEFIKDCVRAGEESSSIYHKYINRWPGTTKRMWEHRLTKANKQIRAEQALITAQANALVQLQIKQRAVRILSIAERKEILTQIALGQLTVNKPVNIGGQIEYVACEPDFTDRRNAIAELNKLDGSYQPTRTEITTNGQNLTPVTTTIIQFNGVDVPLLQ